MKFIKSITIKDKTIPLKSRNLIFTGNNGAGKTYLLEVIFSEIKKLLDHSDYIKNYTLTRRERIIDELSVIFNNFSDTLEINSNDNLIYKDLISNIKEYNTEKFSIQLNDLLKLILKKHETFQDKYNIFLNNQITDRYSDFNPKPTLKNYSNKEYYYKNKGHLDFYIKDLKKEIEKFTNETISIETENSFLLEEHIKNNTLVANYFNATRVETINDNIELSTKDITIYDNLDTLFEDYLTNQFLSKDKKNITHEDDSEENLEFNWFKNIENDWLEKIENDLKFIFESQDTRLSFDELQKKVFIIKDEKYFSLNKLSSGLKAIFKIYASLLVRTKILALQPSELFGIVVIDEIDVHLHISLQKKVMPFLTKAFPNIQFIVSTHSPFVITSTNNDTVVYDVSHRELFDADLSRYSYNSVIKGLFHVDTQSDQLETEIQIIATILKSEPNNYFKLRETLRNIAPYAKQLDVESKSFYFKALNHLLDNQELGDLDV